MNTFLRAPRSGNSSMLYYKHQFVSVDRTLELYFVGCHLHCQGCHNEVLQKVTSNTKSMTPQEIANTLKDYISIANQVHILGGEPLEQPKEELVQLFHILKQLGFKNITLFTGRTINPTRFKKSDSFFGELDYVKTGMYNEHCLNISKEKEPLLGLILASTNQHLYKVVD